MEVWTNSIPSRFETERLTLCVPRIEDTTQVFEAILESLADLTPWIRWIGITPNIETCKTHIQQFINSFLSQEAVPFHMYLRGTEVFVGASGIYNINWITRKFGLGYWCRTAHTGHGYVTEAVNAITAFAFRQLQANRVEIRCDTRNARSAAVARRCGFLQEAILRHDDLGTDGDLRSTFVFSKINPNEFNYYDATGQTIEG